MPSKRRSHKWRWIVGILVVLVAVGAACVEIIITHAEPILRTRVIDTLVARFKSKVELAELHVWVADGLHVDGKGLKIYGAGDPNRWEPGVQPLLEVGEFRFQTALRGLFREPMHIDTVYVSGMVVNIPPRDDSRQMSELRQGGRGFKTSIAVDNFACTNTKLIINTAKPDKRPREFDIRDLRMKDIGPGLPLRFDATLTNPKPVGAIQSTGQVGPINEKRPRDTAVLGNYTFTKADLGTFPGIGGILSSTGKYGGTLARIEVEGQTDTPDFRLTVSGHRVPLHTDFHAIVDGTDGDVYLDPVRARVLDSWFTASGKIVRTNIPHGHYLQLNVVIGHARIEDLLKLGIRTEPPVMTGIVAMNTKLTIPPGDVDVANRLELDGNFHITGGHFTSDKIQKEIDALSVRSRGSFPVKGQPDPVVNSDLKGTFNLSRGVLAFSNLDFLVPGTHADMTGKYSLDGDTFDFHGQLRLDAKLSQMTSGWKSILLRPFDPLLQKPGAGTEIPFKISGTREAPRFGLDFHHKEDHPKQNHLTEAPGHETASQ